MMRNRISDQIGEWAEKKLMQKRDQERYKTIQLQWEKCELERRIQQAKMRQTEDAETI